jgi:hypothetical protein
VEFVLPDTGVDRTWSRLIDTAGDDAAPKAQFDPQTVFRLEAHALALFVSAV